MDIVIGIGTLLGQSLPENFDKPFTARSFLEFWQRWHMTLSQWFKFYVFNPLLMFLMTWLPSPALTSYLGVLAFFITFLVMGVWHGTTAVFVIYGLLMGAGASINKLWQVACTERLGKKRYRVLTESTAYIYFARGVTVGYFVLALTCLWVVELPRIHTFADESWRRWHSLYVRRIGCGLRYRRAGPRPASVTRSCASPFLSGPGWGDRQESDTGRQDDGDLCGRDPAAQGSGLRLQGVLI